MDALFTACLEVLQEALVPLHYHQLTLRAFTKMQAQFSQTSFHEAFKKNRENVREKFLERRWHGHAFYVGEPYCLGALRTWFTSPQLLLLHTDMIRIPGHATAGSEGAFEALMRAPYMQTKHPSASLEERQRGLARGQVIEKHMQQWFKDRYPQLYRPSRNHQQWHVWDKDDFYLQIGDRLLCVDIMGPTKHGTYAVAQGKHRTELHLLCTIKGPDCLFEGVERGKALQDHVVPEACFSPVNFLVWLHCLRDGIDYKTLRDHAH
jgi:hypothetical protein